ncbi:MAG TPA: 2Fe-2S iron-sulfur cluster-binding protein [Thermoanaerobaculia bacterium]|nr:2Fe-2S iron-sulfur cluster-binding protein [Thermoanaerobaculia bacterium]
MPTVTINGRSVEVPAGTNVIEAAKRVGVQIPHYCYHPRLSIVGQCRMCLVQVDGQPKLQAGCSMTVQKDGMAIRTDVPEVEEGQRAMMEFLLINHPLDCPICDQAGECGLQDYAFKHGQAFSRFRFEEKRTYPGRERIPLGPNVLLNMNRCIQCTRCVRFTQEVSKTGSLGFFNRGARTEIGTFPGKELDDPLATNVVDICPVGALTSTRFRFAERVWYLDKKPSICTGCDVGCNVTLEHRRGAIRRYKPRANPEVNDFWLCDYGRSTHERYRDLPRLAAPRVGQGEGAGPVGWQAALDTVHAALTSRSAEGALAFLAGPGLTTEEAYLLARLADRVGSPHRAVHADAGPERTIPRPQGPISGTETGPNRRGAELAGLATPEGGMTAADLLEGDGAARCAVLVVADSHFGAGAYEPETVARLRRAKRLVVLGWADSPLARAADVALPIATHAETGGTFVNVERRLQRFDRAFPAPGGVRPGVEVLGDLLSRFDASRSDQVTPAEVFDRMAAELPAFSGLTFDDLPAIGTPLQAPAEEPQEALVE